MANLDKGIRMSGERHTRQGSAVLAYLDVARTGAMQPAVVPLQDVITIGRQIPAGAGADFWRTPESALSSALLVAAGAPESVRSSTPALASPDFLGIPEPTVSRRHARIERRGSSYVLQDLHSVNGTFVDGERLASGASRVLRDGDELSISSVCMTFHSLLPTPEIAPAVVRKALDATVFTRIDAVTDDAATGSVSALDLQATNRKLHAMAQVSIALGVVRDRATLVEKIMKFIFDLFPLAERAFILFLEHGLAAAALPLTADAVRSRDGHPLDARTVRMSRSIVRAVLEKKQAILSVDLLADRHFGAQESILAQPIRSVMCVPLLAEGDVLGLIQVDTASSPEAFSEQDLEMLTGVCAEAAITLKTFRLYADIETLLDGFVRASVQAIEERDPATAGHSFRVAASAEKLARAVDRADVATLRAIRFSGDQLREIRYAALLHDFGKVGVREHILRKEKKLHHADLRLLEQRFLTVRASLERAAYRELVEEHALDALDIAAFREKKAHVEQMLQTEFCQLDAFLAMIMEANEPMISGGAPAADLQALMDYRYPAANGASLPLLEPFEFSSLKVTQGCLTEHERQQIESHVADSYAFLVLIPWTSDLAGVPAIAHGHHEKLDGSGYPRHLSGDQISMQMRILTICDIFDALTASDRPYKKAVPVERALEMMAAECRCGRLDAAVFDVFAQSQSWREQCA